MDLKLEVVPIPVSDVDAAKAFYTERVGFGLDHDVAPANGMRGVEIGEVQQLGPEGSPGSRFAFFSDPDGNEWAVQER